MEINRVITGSLEENCYVLRKKDTVLIVDPGDDYPKIKEVIKDSKVLGVLITHSHFDHIGALRSFLTKRNVKIFKKSNLEEKTYEIGDFSFDVIFTKGHCSDSVTFYFKNEKVMFVGDFIFKDSVGRCDLPTGSITDMNASLAKIKKYNDDIVLYPGHRDMTTLRAEKQNNIYFKEGM